MDMNNLLSSEGVLHANIELILIIKTMKNHIYKQKIIHTPLVPTLCTGMHSGVLCVIGVELSQEALSIKRSSVKFQY